MIIFESILTTFSSSIIFLARVREMERESIRKRRWRERGKEGGTTEKEREREVMQSLRGVSMCVFP